MVMGIDIGSSCCAEAYLDWKGTSQVLKIPNSPRATPSAVLFEEETRIIVGTQAKEKLLLDPENVVFVNKQQMGRGAVLREGNGIQYTSDFITGFLMKKIVQRARDQYGDQLTGAVMTLPVYFGDAQKKAAERAANMAGIPLVGVIDEASAAVLYYTRARKVRGKHFLVYDFGGSCLDVSLVRAENKNPPEVIASRRVYSAGGRIFDQLLVDCVRKEVEEHDGIDLEVRGWNPELQEIYLQAERAKIQLSTHTGAEIDVRLDGSWDYYTLGFSRNDFEEMIAHTCARTMETIREVIDASGWKTQEIDAILLAGGCCNIPFVQEQLAAFQQRSGMGKVEKTDRLDQVSAMGAALYAGMPESKASLLKSEYVCGQGIGAVFYDDAYHPKNQVLIPRGSILPAEGVRQFRTIRDKQPVLKLAITQGDYPQLSDVMVLKELELELPEGLSKHARIELKLRLEASRAICVDVKIPDVGFQRQFRVEHPAGTEDVSMEAVWKVLEDYEVR